MTTAEMTKARRNLERVLGEVDSLEAMLDASASKFGDPAGLAEPTRADIAEVRERAQVLLNMLDEMEAED